MMQRMRTLLRSTQWLPIAPLLIAPLILFADVLLTGRALTWGLPAIQFVPWRYASWLSLKAGQLPLWNPLNGMGAPLLANYQLAFYYPPGWLLYGFAAAGGAPAIAWGYTLLAALHMAWAGIGMAILLRNLKQGVLAQTVGGLSFGLCGYFTARSGVFPMVWTGSWLPWVILTANRLVSHQPGSLLKKLISLAVTMAMLLLAGHAQLAWYTLLLAGVWVLVTSWQQGGWRASAKALGQYVLAGLLAGILACAQLVPTAQYLMQSQRASSVDYDLSMTYSFWPWRFLALFAPDFFGNPGLGNYWGYASYWEDAAYIGLLPMIMAVSTLSLLRRRPSLTPAAEGTTNLVRFLWIIVLASLLLALGRNTPLFPFLYRYIPTFNMFQAPARFLIWSDAALALLAGIGVEHWRKPSGKQLRWLKRGVAAAASLVLGAGAALLIVSNIELTFVRATALAGVFALGTGILTLKMPPQSEALRHKRWTAAVVLWVSLDLLAAGSVLHPSAPAEVYAENAGYNAGIRDDLNGTRVYLSQNEDYRLKYSRFLRFSDFRPIEDWQHIRQVLLPNTNLLDGIALTSNFDPLVPGRYSRWMDYLESLTREERVPWLRLMNTGLVEQINPWNSLGVDYLPVDYSFRWYWSSCPVLAGGEEDSWRLLQGQVKAWDGSNRPEWVVLESANVPALCVSGSEAEIHLIDESADRLVFKVNTDQSGWLVLHDTWYPGWNVQVDGQSSDTPLRANYLFRAVAVPSGQHMVTFNYSPPDDKLARVLSGIGWVGIAVAMWVLFQPKTEKSQHSSN